MLVEQASRVGSGGESFFFFLSLGASGSCCISLPEATSVQSLSLWSYESETWVGAAICALTSPPGDSVAC